MGCSS